MKKTIGKILILVSLGLVLLSVVSLFLPAFKLEFIDYCKPQGGDEVEALIGTGSITSLLAIMLRLPCTIVYNPIEGATFPKIVDSYRMNKAATLPARIQFIVFVVLVLLTITIFILILTKKFNGKLKVILSICFWVLLVAIAGSALLERALSSVKVSGEIEKIIQMELRDKDHELYIRQTALGPAPIMLLISTAGALVTNIVGSILNRDK